MKLGLVLYRHQRDRDQAAAAIISIAATMLTSAYAQEATPSKIEFKKGEMTVFEWQSTPLSNPKGGGNFAASAFIHPLRTPSGFLCTTIQPSDHPHHFGIWWPWKFVEVDGKLFNTWEIQKGEGAHVAQSAKVLSSKSDQVIWEVHNETLIKPQGSTPKAVIHETSRITGVLRDDATVVDIQIEQKAIDVPVRIAQYRYSGFTWRGPQSWNKDNSTLKTSGGKGRDEANGTPARWSVVSGPSTHGTASVLILSAAEKLSGEPEKLRVWDSKTQNGEPFVNFNPVSDKTLPLDGSAPSVSKRKYRVIAADHLIDETAAQAEWSKWMAE